MTQPGSFGSLWPKDEAWLVRKVQELEQTVQQLRAARTLEASTIGAGGLQVESGGSIRVVAPNGAVIAILGALPSSFNRIDGTPQQGVMFLREDSTVAMVLADANPTTNPIKQAFQIQDRSANIVIADDTNSGTGIARPYVPVATFVDIGSTSVPMTNSATYTDIQWGFASRQHPKVTCAFLIRSDAVGTTGNVRLLDGLGNQVGPAVAVGSNSFTTATIGPVAWPAGWSFTEGLVTMSLQAQRTAGTGNIGGKVLGCWGVQS